MNIPRDYASSPALEEAAREEDRAWAEVNRLRREEPVDTDTLRTALFVAEAVSAEYSLVHRRWTDEQRGVCLT